MILLIVFEVVISSLINNFLRAGLKGNVLDLAVGVIIGGAFGKIVSSLVNDILMASNRYIFGRSQFCRFKICDNPYEWEHC